MPEIELLRLQDSRWKAFLAARPDRSALHHPAWAQLLAETYGFRVFVLALPDGNGDGAVSAGVPALEVGLPGRRRWVSLPFTDSCPPLVSPDDEPAFANALKRLRHERGVPQIELRGELAATEGQTRPVGVVHELALEADPDAVFARLHKTKVRQRIRRTERDGVVVRRGTTMEDLTDTYYRLHVLTRRRLGVPVQPRRLFRLIWKRMLEPGLGDLLLAEHGGTAIAGAVFLHSAERTVYKFSASAADAWRLHPNHAVLWRAISDSCLAGRRVFDFGRSSFEDHGLREFKGGWGTEERPLVYTTIGGGPPNLTLGTAAKAARGLIQRSPAWLCELLGRALYKYAA